MAEVLGYALLMLMGFDGAFGEAMAKARRAGVYDKYRTILSDLTKDTAYINYLLPLLESRNAQLVAEKIKSSPYGTRASKLAEAVKTAEQEITDKRAQLKENEVKYADAIQRQQTELENASSSGSGIIDIIEPYVKPQIKDLVNRAQTLKAGIRNNTFKRKGSPFVKQGGK